MRKTPLLAAAAILVSAIAGAPKFALAVEGANPAAPASTTQQPSSPSGTKKAKKTKPQKSSSAEDFLNGWHKAYALVYDKQDYEGGIAVLRAMGYDDNAGCGDADRLRQPQARPLRRRQTLVRPRARRRSQPRADLVLLRHVAGRTGQHAQGQGRPRKGRAASAAPPCREYTALKAAIDGTVTY